MTMTFRTFAVQQFDKSWKGKAVLVDDDQGYIVCANYPKQSFETESAAVDAVSGSEPMLRERAAGKGRV